MFYTIHYDNEINEFYYNILPMDFVNDLQIMSLNPDNFFKFINLMD